MAQLTIKELNNKIQKVVHEPNCYIPTRLLVLLLQLNELVREEYGEVEIDLHDRTEE